MTGEVAWLVGCFLVSVVTPFLPHRRMTLLTDGASSPIALSSPHGHPEDCEAFFQSHSLLYNYNVDNLTSALKNSKLCQSLAGSQDQQNEFHLTNIKEEDISVPGSHRALSSSINEK